MAEPGPHSVHGGVLPFDEQWIRAEAHAMVFGDAPELKLGRYEIRERLGAGGMGTVFLARDPELQRDVAIKVLHSSDPGASERLRREARALAALAHPNVVMVFEVGELDGVLYIAMEYVEGPTLRSWQVDRTPAEILAAYAQAGRGLEAAHHAGVIHGDFKPDNALVSTDGRVRVADFGLSARQDGMGPYPTERAQTIDGAQTGAGGTPGYRAPELDAGSAPDPRSDQYALCVSISEALAGRRPRGAEGVRGLPASRRVRAALARGLDADPSRRFPSLDALVRALAPRSRTWLLMPAVAVALGAAVALARPPDCDDVGPRPWSGARAHAREAFDAEPAWVARSWPGLDEALTSREAALADAHADACRLTSGRSPELTERAEACLDQAWGELEVLASALAAGEQEIVRTAPLRLAFLLPSTTCADEAALDRIDPEPDPSLRAKLTTVLLSYSRMPGTQPTFSWSHVEEGIAHGGRIEAIARRVRAHDALGRGAHEDAIEDLRVAASIAVAQADAPARIQALTLLAFAIGQDTRRLVEAEQVASSALDLLDAGPPHPLLRARLLHDLASIAAHARPPRSEQAVELHQEATGILGETLGPEHPLTVRARISLGTALTRADRLDDALAILTTVDAQVDALWRRDEPTWIRSRRALGLAHLAAGEAAAAWDALAQAERARGALPNPAPLERSRDAYNVALALRALGRDAEAVEALERGYPLAVEALGRDHPELTPWVALLGRTALGLRREREAARWFERGLELCEIDGAAPKEFAKLRVGLAEALASLDPVVARVHLEAARRFLDSTEGFSGLRARADALEERLKARARPATEGRSRGR